MVIERKEYLEKLIAWKDKQLIKIVTGVRRCGKSMLLEIYRKMCIRDSYCGCRYCGVSGDKPDWEAFREIEYGIER